MGYRLMCVVAHPDDECYAFGGALALAVDRGVETHVICMTDGQAAKNRGDAASGQELGRIRRAEFAASCRVLGVTKHELLDYHDGQMMNVSFPEATGLLVQRIRSIRPQVVLTFGGDGGLTTHPDHMMVSFLTSAAFHFSSQEKRFPELGQVFRPERLFHVSSDEFLPDRQRPQPIPWSVKLDIRSVQERKYEAFRTHVSQAPLIEATRDFFAAHGANEFYALIASNEAQPSRSSADLFDGL